MPIPITFPAKVELGGLRPQPKRQMVELAELIRWDRVYEIGSAVWAAQDAAGQRILVQGRPLTLRLPNDRANRIALKLKKRFIQQAWHAGGFIYAHPFPQKQRTTDSFMLALGGLLYLGLPVWIAWTDLTPPIHWAQWAMIGAFVAMMLPMVIFFLTAAVQIRRLSREPRVSQVSFISREVVFDRSDGTQLRCNWDDLQEIRRIMYTEWVWKNELRILTPSALRLNTVLNAVRSEHGLRQDRIRPQRIAVYAIGAGITAFVLLVCTTSTISVSRKPQWGAAAFGGTGMIVATVLLCSSLYLPDALQTLEKRFRHRRRRRKFRHVR